MKDYEINSATLAIIPLGENVSEVYETEAKYIVNKSPNAIIKDNCEFYGSSYEGRCKGTKNLTGIRSKYPIIIEESRNIIFFPTSSIRSNDNVWIALNNIKNYSEKNKNSKIVFKNNENLELYISYYSLDNQICRAHMLNSKLYDRKKVRK